MTQKHIGMAGLAITIIGGIVAVAVAHADVSGATAQNGDDIRALESRVHDVERDIDDVLWNISLLCERAGAQGCRSGSQ